MMDDTTVDTAQQVTSKDPTTSVKNPKRVAAGKVIAEKRRLAKEAQKQKMAEADIIIANERLKKTQEETKKVDQSPPETMLPDTAPPKETFLQTLTMTQWLSVIAISVLMVGVYYKREEIKNSLSKIKAPASATVSAPASANAQTAPAPANAPVVKTPKRVGIQMMA